MLVGRRVTGTSKKVPHSPWRPAEKAYHEQGAFGASGEAKEVLNPTYDAKWRSEGGVEPDVQKHFKARTGVEKNAALQPRTGTRITLPQCDYRRNM